MAFETRSGCIGIIIIYIQIFLCSLLSVFMASHGTDTDIFCLKSIMDSLEDPYNYLRSSWNFNNNTEGFICRFNGVECWHPDENRVLNLKLSNLGLKGEFPRGIRNCSSLTGLDLSVNKFSGTIPSDISQLLTFLTSIDLSSNKFSGEIPASLGNCSYLNSLKLNNNMLSGRIPQELGQLTRIKFVSFANNHLTGNIPEFPDWPGTVDSYANNKGLCGGPLPPCSSGHGNGILHQLFKISLIIGFAFAFTSVVVVHMFCSPRTQTQLKQNRNKHRNKLATRLGQYIRHVIPSRTRIVSNQIHEFLPLQLQEKERKMIALLMERLTSTMTLDELNDATDCFSIDSAIGVGKMGIMYKGMLQTNGCPCHLAVKRLFNPQLFERQFLLETRILGKLQHTNIIPLLGFCLENKESILVYQYMSNGRLSKWLNPLETEVMRLTWPERVKIALGVARALSWLHHTSNLHIVHLNISSECILLDESFEPKVSNFGEAKFMNPKNEDDLGNAFYVKDGKKDVYDFGSVLFELLTGKTYNELLCSLGTGSLCDDPLNFCDAVDKLLIGKGFDNEVFALIKLACECVQPFPDQRPTMLQVYNNMGRLWEGQQGLGDDSDVSMLLEIVSATDIDEIVEL